MLSGTAQSMGQLIAMRTIQGLGAGAVAPIVLTLLGDLFTLEERARIQGLFSTVWGLSSIAGPLIGGWLTVNLNWRWVFFVSVPFAVVAFAHARLVPPRASGAADRGPDRLGRRRAAHGGTLLAAAHRARRSELGHADRVSFWPD